VNAQAATGLGTGKQHQSAAGGGGGAGGLRSDSPHSGGAHVTPSDGSQRRREIIGGCRQYTRGRQSDVSGFSSCGLSSMS
jgi:hypothetical protein